MFTSVRASLAAVVLGIAASAFSQPQAVDPNIAITPIITNGSLSQPTCMAFLSDADILVGEKATGLVKRITNGVVNATAVLNLPVNSASERGLLGMTLHPQFATNNFVYVFYTRSNTGGDTSVQASVDNQRVERYTWNGTSLVFNASIINLPVLNGPNHDGGIILFGPPSAAPAAQKLFVVLGDLNRTGKNQNYATGGNEADDSGAILRVNADGSTPSGAEKGPFFDVVGANTSLQRTYAYGIRNCFGMGFDPVTDKLWMTENGPGVYDEINLVDPGLNSGWRRFMGPASRNSTQGAPSIFNHAASSTYSDPEFSWLNPVAVTSIHFNRSNGMGAAYLNDCFVGDNNTGNFYRFDMNPTRDGFTLATPSLADMVLDGADSNTEFVFGSGFPVVTDIENSPNGDFHILSLALGQIYKLKTTVTAVDEWRIYE